MMHAAGIEEAETIYCSVRYNMFPRAEDNNTALPFYLSGQNQTYTAILSRRVPVFEVTCSSGGN